MKKFLIVFLLAVAVGGGSFLIYRHAFRKPEIQILESSTIERGNIREVLVETGIIKPQVGAVVKIGSRITGDIVKMNVKIGDPVKRGDLIARIDDREILKVVARQEAALQAARDTLRQVELTFPERIREAQANLGFARVNHTREVELIKHEYTTQDAVDRALRDLKTSEANLKRLRDEYATQRVIAQSRVEEAEAQLSQSRVNHSYTTILAPIDGVVSDVTIQEGETIVTGLQVANLVTVLDPTSLEMWIYVDETNIGRAQLGQEVEYYVDAFPEKNFQGTIGRIHPQPVVKDNIVYYLATVEVDRADAQFLKPEMTAHVRIIVQEKKEILTAPNAAVKFEQGRHVIYRVTGEKRVERLEPRTGIRGEDRTEILEGVNEGDVVATRIILPPSS